LTDVGERALHTKAEKVEQHATNSAGDHNQPEGLFTPDMLLCGATPHRNATNPVQTYLHTPTPHNVHVTGAAANE